LSICAKIDTCNWTGTLWTQVIGAHLLSEAVILKSSQIFFKGKSFFFWNEKATAVTYVILQSLGLYALEMPVW
jgi:hypothetical protein